VQVTTTQTLMAMGIATVNGDFTETVALSASVNQIGKRKKEKPVDRPSEPIHVQPLHSSGLHLRLPDPLEKGGRERVDPHRRSLDPCRPCLEPSPREVAPAWIHRGEGGGPCLESPLWEVAPASRCRAKGGRAPLPPCTSTKTAFSWSDPASCRHMGGVRSSGRGRRVGERESRESAGKGA
jgi:hypothetical protein